MNFDIRNMGGDVHIALVYSDKFTLHHIEDRDALGATHSTGPGFEFAGRAFEFDEIAEFGIFGSCHIDFAVGNTQDDAAYILYALNILNKSKIDIYTFGAHSTLPPLIESDPQLPFASWQTFIIF
jgi:hypothetical protein